MAHTFYIAMQQKGNDVASIITRDFAAEFEAMLALEERRTNRINAGCVILEEDARSFTFRNHSGEVTRMYIASQDGQREYQAKAWCCAEGNLYSQESGWWKEKDKAMDEAEQVLETRLPKGLRTIEISIKERRVQ